LGKLAPFECGVFLEHSHGSHEACRASGETSWHPTASWCKLTDTAWIPPPRHDRHPSPRPSTCSEILFLLPTVAHPMLVAPATFNLRSAAGITFDLGGVDHNRNFDAQLQAGSLSLLDVIMKLWMDSVSSCPRPLWISATYAMQIENYRLILLGATWSKIEGHSCK
jgi:hypothetical protein